MQSRPTRAFSLVDLIVLLALFFALSMLVLPSVQRQRTSAPRLNCINNLKLVGLAYRNWAMDHNDQFPMQSSITNGGTREINHTAKAFRHYQPISEELSTPKVLLCPSDRKRKAATNFVNFSNQNLSYFVGIDAAASDPQMFLAGDRNLTNATMNQGFLELTSKHPAGWTEQLHQGQGNICLSDGSVMLLRNARLRGWTVGLTNRLLLP